MADVLNESWVRASRLSERRTCTRFGGVDIRSNCERGRRRQALGMALLSLNSSTYASAVVGSITERTSETRLAGGSGFRFRRA